MSLEQIIKQTNRELAGNLSGDLFQKTFLLFLFYRCVSDNFNSWKSEVDLFYFLENDFSRLENNNPEMNGIFSEFEDIKKNISERDLGIFLKNLDNLDVQKNNNYLGDAYEFIAGNYSLNSGGEFFTPKSLSQLVARLATNCRENIKNVYDPTCGSGSLLLEVCK